MAFRRDRDAQEVQLADVLSPVSKKRTGRAYVALARAHCQKFVGHPSKLIVMLMAVTTGAIYRWHSNSTAKQKAMCQTTSSSKRGGYFSLFMFF
jgi:hypothetical protein